MCKCRHVCVHMPVVTRKTTLGVIPQALSTLFCETRSLSGLEPARQARLVDREALRKPLSLLGFKWVPAHPAVVCNVCSGWCGTHKSPQSEHFTY